VKKPLPVIVNVERSSTKELDGGFRVSGKGVNLWIRVYQTDYGKRVRITVSYLKEGRWITTPALWIDKTLMDRFLKRLKSISSVLT